MKKVLLFILIIILAEYVNAQKGITLFVRNDTVNPKPVSPMIYGNFIEMGFGKQIDGLWGQKLYNGSFERVPPYDWGWIGRSPKDDITKETWWHTGYEDPSWYLYPEDSQLKIEYLRYGGFYQGLQAALIKNPFKDKKIKLAQDGVYLDAATPTRFAGFFINSHDADSTYNPVKLTIGLYPEKNFDKPLYEADIEVRNGVWREYGIEIPAIKYKGRMTFAISVEPDKTVFCDGLSLMPVNDSHGWRPEAVKALKQIGVPIIRYPGGCFASFYDWRNGIGPRGDRKPEESKFWGGIEENQAGTAEFADFCKMTNSEPFFCVNVLTGSANMAADWVEYCNGSINTKMGALRMKHGYLHPFKVKYWELDNEAYRRMGAIEYAKRCVEYGKAMKAVDPDIKLVMIGYWTYNRSLADMLKIAGPYIDVITNRSLSEAELQNDIKVINQYNRANGTSIKLCNTEWLAPCDWENYSVDGLNVQKMPNQMSFQENQITWNYAMNAIRVLFMFQRLGGDFLFSNFNNMANTWGQNIVECPKDTVFISAAGRAFELMSRSNVSWVLKSEPDKEMKGLHFQTGISSDGKQLIVYVLNFNLEGKQIQINTGSYVSNGSTAKINEVFAKTPFSSNTAKHPDEIHRNTRFVKSSGQNKVQISVLPSSATEIILPLK